MFAFSQLGDWIIENWELIAAGIGGLFALITAGFALRQSEKAGIHKTNAANIHALQDLIATRDREITDRDREIQDRDETIAELEDDNERLEAALEAARSEYKIVAGIILGDLIKFHGEKEKHISEMENLRSEIRILKLRLERLEAAAADGPTL